MRATGGAVKPLPWKGRRGLGIRVEAPSYEEGVGVDGEKKAKKELAPFKNITCL